MPGPAIYLHELAGQRQSCLCGLVQYAERIAGDRRTKNFRTPREVAAYLWRAPVELDRGEAPKQAGCIPQQRSRIWPQGFNCWEAVAHYTGVALATSEPVEIHIYDAAINGQRHVFPAVRPLGSAEKPVPVVLQPPARTGIRAQALTSDIVAPVNDLPPGIRLLGGKRFDWFSFSTGGPEDFAKGSIEAMGARFHGMGPLPASVTEKLPPIWSQLHGWIGALGGNRFLWAVKAEPYTVYIYEVSVGGVASSPVPTVPGAPPVSQPERPPPGAPPVAQGWDEDIAAARVELLRDAEKMMYVVGRARRQLSEAEAREFALFIDAETAWAFCLILLAWGIRDYAVKALFSPLRLDPLFAQLDHDAFNNVVGAVRFARDELALIDAASDFTNWRPQPLMLLVRWETQDRDYRAVESDLLRRFPLPLSVRTRYLAATTGRQPAQGWEDVFGAVHWAGDKVLRVFNAGSVSDQIAAAAGETLPEWAKTDEQKAAWAKQQAEAAARKADEAKAQAKSAEAEARAVKTQATATPAAAETTRAAEDNEVPAAPQEPERPHGARKRRRR